jgi:hypothetical protein
MDLMVEQAVVTLVEIVEIRTAGNIEEEACQTNDTLYTMLAIQYPTPHLVDTMVEP